MHDDDTDDLDFAMLTPPTRPGPCKAATAPEVDPVERRRLERARDAAEHIAADAEAKALARGALPCNALSLRNQVRQYEMCKEAARFIVTDLPCIDRDGSRAKVSVETLGGGTFRMSINDAATLERFMTGMGVEVRHGSGKVKV